MIAIPVSGAYQLSMASTYNGTPRPAVLWLHDGHAHLAQRRETLPPSSMARAEIAWSQLDHTDATKMKETTMEELTPAR